MTSCKASGETKTANIIVEETMGHPTQKLAEQGHDVSYGEALKSI